MQDILSIHDLILTRRSIRKFKPDPIPSDVLQRIMNSAIWAPSSMNRQPWKFFVFQGEMRDRLAALHQSIFTPDKEEEIRKNYGEDAVAVRRNLYANLGGAPVAIVCFTDIIGDKPDKVSAALACQTLALAAWSEGYASLMMGSSLQIADEIQFLCNVNDNEMALVMCILLGLPDETPEPKDRRKNRVVFASNPKDL